MKRTEKDLQKYYEECRQIMIGLGYDAKIVPISLNGRLRSTIGRYFTYEKRIEIAKDYFLNADEHYVKNTILHEICHQVCRVSGHGTEWKRIANHVSMKTPYKIERLASKGEMEFFAKTSKKEREKKYGVKCTKCERVWRYATKSKAYRSPSTHSCPYCKVKKTLVSVDF